MVGGDEDEKEIGDDKDDEGVYRDIAYRNQKHIITEVVATDDKQSLIHIRNDEDDGDNTKR